MKLWMKPSKSECENAAAISSRESDGSISRSVSGSTEPSRCRCNSALCIEVNHNARQPSRGRKAGACRGTQPALKLTSAIITVVQTEEIQAIVAGRHRDPFAVLGPHEDEIRAWLPGATEVS